MVVAHPFVVLFDRYQRKAHHLIAKIWATLTIFPFFKVEFEGLENLPTPETPAVYVSNHQSFLDIYTLLVLGRSFKFISKTGIFVFPIVGWAMFLMGFIPLKRMDSRSQLVSFVSFHFLLMKLCEYLVLSSKNMVARNYGPFVKFGHFANVGLSKTLHRFGEKGDISFFLS